MAQEKGRWGWAHDAVGQQDLPPQLGRSVAWGLHLPLGQHSPRMHHRGDDGGLSSMAAAKAKGKPKRKHIWEALTSK